jgi:ATP adenylyltransferase
MAYLESSEPVHGCVFCAKAREDRDVENHIVYRTDRVFVMLNLYPYNSGHLLIIPYQHTGDLSDVEPETAGQIMSVAQLAVRAIGDSMGPEGYNLGLNQGSAAGAGIADHVHLHVVPRWGGDTNFMPVLADAKVMPELLAATTVKLREAFARVAPPA